MAATEVTPARNRTQRAILSAAAAVWARDRTATLPQIAEAAEVGRTTLHRYFPDREGLAAATEQHAYDSVVAAVAAAEPEHGPPVQAMRRVVGALASVSDSIMFLFGDQSAPREQPADAATRRDPVLELIRRGQADGVFDAEVSAEWLQQVLWALSYTAFEQVERGSLARFDVVATVTRSLEGGIVVDGRQP